MTTVDPRAVVDASAAIGVNVEIGPYAIIGKQVEIDEGTRIGSHVVIDGITQIGRDNQIHPFSSLGGDPQDKKYQQESTKLIIGNRNVIREYCTFNRGTVQDQGITCLGDDNWIMAYVHLAHDCQVGNHTIFANGVSLAGHVHVEDKVVLGGFTAVHQYCQIGYHAFSGVGTIVKSDIPPYIMISGSPAKPYGLNTEGLKRSGLTADEIKVLKRAYKTLYKSGKPLQTAIEEFEQMACENHYLSRLAVFLRQSKRGIVR